MLQLLLMAIGLAFVIRYSIEFIWGTEAPARRQQDRHGQLPRPADRAHPADRDRRRLRNPDRHRADAAHDPARQADAGALRRPRPRRDLRHRHLEGDPLHLAVRRRVGGARRVFAGALTQLQPELGFELLLPIFAAVVLGGIGNAFGALAAGIVLGVVIEWSTFFVAPGLKLAVGFVILIIVLIIRPQGIFGQARTVWPMSDPLAIFSSRSHSRRSPTSTSEPRSGSSPGSTRSSRSGCSSTSASPGSRTSARPGSWRSAPTMAIPSPPRRDELLAQPPDLDRCHDRLRAHHRAAVAAAARRLLRDRTIASAEAIRLIALNARDLTNGAQGIFGFDDSWNSSPSRSRSSSSTSAGPTSPPSSRSSSSRGDRGPAHVRLHPCPGHALGARPACRPRGRGRRQRAGQERVLLQAAVAGDRGHDRRGVRFPARDPARSSSSPTSSSRSSHSSATSCSSSAGPANYWEWRPARSSASGRCSRGCASSVADLETKIAALRFIIVGLVLIERWPSAPGRVRQA